MLPTHFRKEPKILVFAQRAYTLEALGTHYFVLGAPKIAAVPNVENCLSAVSGISRFGSPPHQHAVEPIQTGTLRGQAGTDHIARELLKQFAIAPSEKGLYGSHDDRWVVQALLHTEPAAKNSAMKWYFLAP